MEDHKPASDSLLTGHAPLHSSAAARTARGQGLTLGSNVDSSPFKRIAALSQGAVPAFGAPAGGPAATQAPVEPAFALGASASAAVAAAPPAVSVDRVGSSCKRAALPAVSALLVEVVALVLAQLEDDFKALACSVCVSRVWRKEARRAACSLHVPIVAAWPAVGQFPDCQRISLDCRVGTSIKDLAPLSTLSQLASFEAGSLSHLTSVAGLASVAATLRELELGSCRPEGVDWAPIASLTQLTRLQVSNSSSFNDSSPLSTLVLLEYLDLHFNRSLSELDGLSALTRLTLLIMDHTGVYDLEPLSTLTALVELNCEECPNIASLRELLPLTHLTFLSCARCIGLEDLPGVPSSVRELDCSNAYTLTSLEGLENAQASLRTALISGVKHVTSLLPLSTAVNLMTLTMDSCAGMTSFDDLRSLESLSSLSAKSCRELKNLQALSTFTALRSLDIGGSSAIKSVAPLRELPGLMHLNIQGCYGISDIHVLDAKRVQVDRGGPWGNPFGKLPW